MNTYEIEVKDAAVFADAANAGFVIDTDMVNMAAPSVPVNFFFSACCYGA